eukprot:10069247-Heterocapsa_arctica.AAC.1
MVQVLLVCLRRVWKRARIPHDGEFKVAFEWPRGGAGWQQPAMTALLAALPRAAHFDGCAFGLRNDEGQAIRKPWL